MKQPEEKRMEFRSYREQNYSSRKGRKRDLRFGLLKTRVKEKVVPPMLL